MPPSEKAIFKCTSGITWIDLYNPKRSDIENLAKEYGLHSTSVQDCLDPEHLPKFEKFSTYNFLILRAYDERSNPMEADTIQELTRKIAIFFSDKFIITIHRKDQHYISALREKWKIEFDCNPNITISWVLSDLLKQTFLTYEQPIDQGLDQHDQHEMAIFDAPGAKRFQIEDGYFLKRRGFVFKRVLRLSMDSLQKIGGFGDFTQTPYFQDLKETLDNLYFYADELVESMNQLVSMYVSLQQQKTNESSHRINDVMRILTIFSVFFMPLNFLASIYGMNFQHMPELKLNYGYPLVLFIMAATSIAIFLWFKRKGWL